MQILTVEKVWTRQMSKREYKAFLRKQRTMQAYLIASINPLLRLIGSIQALLRLF